MVLMRATLGHRGSYLATGLNVVQCLGWSVYELIIIASASAALSDRVFGFRAQWLWTLLFGGVAIALALLGPVGFVRRYVRKFAVWFVLASLGYLTWWVIDKSDLTAFWTATARAASRPSGRGSTSMLASVISWTPLAADYTRFARNRRTSSGAPASATSSRSSGSTRSACCSSSRATSPTRRSSRPRSSAGGVVSVLALLAVTVDESDEAFANVYSTAVSIQNVVPRVPQRVLIAVGATLATVGALVLDLPSTRRSSSCSARSSCRCSACCSPTGWSRARTTRETTSSRAGRAAGDDPRVARRLRPLPVALAAGARLVAAPLATDPAPIDFTASLPSFAAAFVLAALAGILAAARSPLSPKT